MEGGGRTLNSEMGQQTFPTGVRSHWWTTRRVSPVRDSEPHLGKSAGQGAWEGKTKGKSVFKLRRTHTIQCMRGGESVCSPYSLLVLMHASRPQLVASMRALRPQHVAKGKRALLRSPLRQLASRTQTVVARAIDAAGLCLRSRKLTVLTERRHQAWDSFSR